MTEIITASAGSGKTFRLTELLHESQVPTDRIMATTFTVKAAQELMGRARARLLQNGRIDDAHLLPASLIGTVHSIGRRLLEMFAYELGLSPSLDVIPEADTSVFLQEALEKVLTEPPISQTIYVRDSVIGGPWYNHVHDAADAFGIEPAEWQGCVRAILDAARNNRIEPAALEACGGESAQELLAFLDPPREGDWDGELRAAIEQMLAQVPAPHLKLERDAQQVLTDARDALRQGRLKWSQWPKIAKLKAGTTWNVALEAVRPKALAYLWHPRLRHHIDSYVRGLFRFAAQGLDAYRKYKANYRLIDYGDQEERLLYLLETTESRARIAERVHLLLVDEFQDTSPMQLAIFLKLAQVAKRSIWVGDPKQAIYNFRGTDPQLMHECLTHMPGGEALHTSYRSRPALVDLVSRVFHAPFAHQDIKMVPLQAARTEHSGMPPVLGLWALQTHNKAQDWQAVARGVQRLLERPEETQVEDRLTGQVRPVKAGDIAVLCRQRESCRGLADALCMAGLEVALKQPGVMTTPEGLLATSALRLMLDPTDTLAAATIAFFDPPPGTTADGWLDARLRDVEAGALPTHAWAEHPRVAAVRNAKGQLKDASPTEALEAAMEALDLPRLCLSLPQATQGLANLEAMRALARQYEERCRVLRLPATAAGLLAELHRLNQERQDEGAEGLGDGAVRVLTYHGAKGLEWPVVVLAELDYEGPPAWTGVQVETRGEFSLDNPLDNRHVRFWFSPFESQVQRVEFVDRLIASPTAQQFERRATEERLRLLYVGATRARDHLVVAIRSGADGYQVSWLEMLPDLALPPVAEDTTVDVAGVPTRAWVLPPGLADPTPRMEPRWFALPEAMPPQRLPATVAASSLEGLQGHFTVGEVVRLGDRLKTSAVEERDTLGTAVHAFLAADPGPSGSATAREELAARLLASYGHSGALQPGHLVEASDRLQRFIAERYPGARQYREWPLAFWQDGQEVWGQADLVLETADGLVVVDYKTFEGSPEQAAIRFGGQLATYAKAIGAATGKRCLAVLVYLAFQSVVFEVTASRTPNDLS